MSKVWIVGLTLFATVASAQSIEERQRRMHAEGSMADKITALNHDCGMAVPKDATIDWASWKSSDDGKGHETGGACSWAVYGVRSLCTDDKVAHEIVVKDVKRVKCMGDAKTEPTFEMKGGTLVVHTNLAVEGIDKKTKAWLSKHLD